MRLAAALLFLTACNSESANHPPAAAPAPAPATAASAIPSAAAAPIAVDAAPATREKFIVWNELVTTAGIKASLEGPGPFTLFAPTDEAFAKLDPKKLEELKKDPRRLATVLRHHVLAGKVTAADLKKLRTTKTLDGKDAKVTTSGDAIAIDKSNIVTADIPAPNGVIHAIDAVMMP